MSLTKEEARGVGQIPSGLFIVCAQRDGAIDGYLASFVQQVSFKPLLLCLAVRPGRPAYDLIKQGVVFSINVVGDHDHSFLRHFWSGYDPTLNPFAEIPHHVEEDGTVTLTGAKAVIAARLVDSVQPGDHEVLFVEVLGSRILHEDAQARVHTRKSGLDY